MSSPSGLKLFSLCKKGTLDTSPVNVVVAGVRESAVFEITPHKTITDYRGRKIRNMMNFKAEAESLQPTIKQLKDLIELVNLNADAQFQTTPQTSSAGSEDIFKFVDPNLIGLGFEYQISADKRSNKIMAELALEHDKGVTLIDAADSNSLSALPDITGEGIDFTKMRIPYFLSVQSPTPTELIVAGDIIERKFSIKTKGKKDIYNADIVDYLTFEIELRVRTASVANIVAELNKAIGVKVLFKEKNAGSYFDGFDFNTNVLTQTNEAKINDEEREMKIMFGADVPVYDVTWDLEATGGGEASGDGTVGGTMKLGY